MQGLSNGTKPFPSYFPPSARFFHVFKGNHAFFVPFFEGRAHYDRDMVQSWALEDLFQTYQTSYIVKRNLIAFSVYELLMRVVITNNREAITNRP